MEIYDVMRTTFAGREYTGEELSTGVIYRILDMARFAPSGGNRQGWKVIVVRDDETRRSLVKLTEPAARRYVAQMTRGENPWSSLEPPVVSTEEIAETQVPSVFTDPLLKSSVVLILCLDLSLAASMDQHLDRVGIITGASIYPFAWNILLAARSEGFTGAITTLAAAEEPGMKELFGLPDHVAVCGVVPLGKLVKQLTRLKRKPVQEFAMLEKWGGQPLEPVT